MKFWIRFRRILKNSVITGIPQIVVTRNVIRKAIKLTVFSVCVFGFFYQTFSFLRVYWTYPTVVDVQYLFPDEFELPAITICSYNGTSMCLEIIRKVNGPVDSLRRRTSSRTRRIKSTIFCDKFPNLCHPNKSLHEFCKSHPGLCDQNFDPGNDSYPAVTAYQLPSLSRAEYSAMGLQPEEIMLICAVYDSPRVQNCTGPLMVSVFDNKGLPNNCYSYNSLWGKTKGAKKIKTKTSVYVLLKSESTASNLFYTGTPFALQMAIHSPYAMINPFLNGFTIKPCFNYYIFPTKQVNQLLPPPYASACYDYSVTWIQRSGKGPLSKRLCAEECRLNKSMEKFGCVDPLFIKYPNTAPLCEEKVNSTVLQECVKMCAPACYREDISADVQEHPLAKQRLTVKEGECKSMITISFNRMEVLRYSYSEKYESVSLFSYIGGYLGLWLGISLVAICDVMETALLVSQWIFKKVERRRYNKRVHYGREKSFVLNNGSREMWLL